MTIQVIYNNENSSKNVGVGMNHKKSLKLNNKSTTKNKQGSNVDQAAIENQSNIDQTLSMNPILTST